MSDRLPVRVDPYRLAEQSLTIEGVFNTAKMERLEQSVQSADKQLRATLGFSKQGAAHYFINGNVKLQVQLTCQRCLDSLEHEIDSDFELALVGSELQAEQVMESIEPLLIVEGDMLEMQELLEDELLLGLPTVALHAHGEECQVPKTREVIPQDVAEDLSEKKEPSPFSVLKDLKSD